ncbi:Non-catalytic module family DOC2 [Piromyces sp. E2]|nr:Non-catalytic module family DOC2 [Piromyces sp. E2]|eukprot:OUM62458.1 Non-catalytic module family DOC2 [Piromyces sp. E2]
MKSQDNNDNDIKKDESSPDTKEHKLFGIKDLLKFEEFKTKNATLVVELKGKEKTFKKTTFSIGGGSSRGYGRPGYNLKIRGNKDLYGRSQFRLRPDAREATYIRSKLLCDIHNRFNIPSISANYVTLYINEEYMGLFILMDSIKLSWLEKEYNDVNSTTLYKYVTDNSEWTELLKRLDSAQSVEDVEDFFDVDLFLTEMVIEYLTGSWDHFLFMGHNFNIYKPKNGKWKFMEYDFDGDMGQEISMANEINPNTIKRNSDYAAYSFAQWTKPHHLTDILILNNSTRFDHILRNVVTDVFNPATLFPHIDKIKEFIKPFVVLDKTPNENGKLPGSINAKTGFREFSLAQWDANCEFTPIKTDTKCDPVYLDENYEYIVNKEIENSNDTSDFPLNQNSNNTPSTTAKLKSVTPHLEPTTTVDNVETIATETPQPSPSPYQCWAELIGYSCCPPQLNVVYKHDSNDDWGYDFVKKEWCGLTPYTEPTNDDVCWSEKLGYPCCKSCTVYETDDDGHWGYENHHWCGIQSFCKIE